MVSSKLNLDFSLVEKARKNAEQIANEVQTYIEKHTTVSVERSVARLLGVDGIDENGVPLPNLLVDQLKQKKGLSMGVAFYLGNAMLILKKSPAEIALMISEEGLDISSLPLQNTAEISRVYQPTCHGKCGND